MIEHNFENFDDYEFELLCRDLLNEIQRIDVKSNHGLEYEHILSFSSFKRGKDGGVDLYFEKDNIKVVGQVKLSRGKFSELFNSLKKKVKGINELDKVRKLAPSKYIFMTSVPLSLANKRTLVEYFSPYIISIEDIFGRGNINEVLSRFKHIEKSYVKLYFTNPLVLERLLNQATLQRSQFTKGEIQSQLKLFVQTSNFRQSLSILEKENLLIIKGLPGVGKTTLAKMLSFYYIEKGYSFIEVFELDSEIERLIDTNDEKCIFYYDDFLGSNSLIISDALRNEGRLNSLLRRISQKRNKSLIMTTRTNILRQAEFNSEKLQRAFNIISKYEVEISDLTSYEKNKILTNHIKKNQLDLRVFESNSLRDTIVNHINFSPRLIEYITDSSNFKNKKNDYSTFVISSLDFPERIWSYAYNFQISNVDKLYLNHLFLFGNSCQENQFKKSFSNRLKFEVESNNYSITHREFRESTSTMDGTFITVKSKLHDDEIESSIAFINPSIVDFLMKEIKDNTNLIYGSISNFDEGDIIWNRFNHKQKDLLKFCTYDDICRILLDNNRIKIFSDAEEKIKYLKTLLNYFSISEIEVVFGNEIEEVLSTEIDDWILDAYSDFLIQYKKSSIVSSYIDIEGAYIINHLLDSVNYTSEFENILEMFGSFSIDIRTYLEKKDNKNAFYQAVKRVLSDEIEQTIFERDYIVSYSDVELLKQTVHQTYDKLEKIIVGLNTIISNILDSYDWEHLIGYNQFKASGESEIGVF